MELTNAKGTKDYLPEEMISLNEIMTKLRTYFELAGFNPLTTPAIEKLDVLTAKYAGGSEILKETFQLKDQGGRELGLRYDLTVPFSRVMGMNPQLKLPFKRYQMEKVYRDGPVGPGRYREFWQCDIDMVGSKSMKAEAELLSIVESFFKSYDLKPIIKINNRKIMNAILDIFRIDNKAPVILIIDKFDKLSKEELLQEMLDIGYDSDESKKIIQTFEDLSNLKSNNERMESCSKLINSEEGKEGLQELKEILDFSKEYELDCILFDPMLARGLSYYTGPVFETIISDNPIKSSVCAGGRFDNMIGDFLESKEKYPAVGLSFGVSRIFDALVAVDKIKPRKSVTSVLVIPIATDKECIKIVKNLRENSINTEIDLMNRGISKNLAYANSLGIPNVLIVGENEVKNNTVTLKNLDSGGQKELPIEEVITKLS